MGERICERAGVVRVVALVECLGRIDETKIRKQYSQQFRCGILLWMIFVFYVNCIQVCSRTLRCTAVLFVCPSRLSDDY